MFITVLTSIVLTGCHPTEPVTAGTDVASLLIDAPDQAYQQEYNDLIRSFRRKDTIELSSIFTIQASIKLIEHQASPYIVYGVSIRQVRSVMKDVTFSFMLEPSMIARLQTPKVFYTNVMDKRSIVLDPQVIHTYEETLPLPLAQAKLDPAFMNEYSQLRVKVSWKTEDGKLHTYYQSLRGVPAAELEDYLNQHKL
ncbi:hypothetical protein NV379_01035 [Paenibacillus sp. N1-5-1-14]|uniref:hypothetical protein n=1 Tax=Paenibacillus radicibacter TaxID=2972488 RepID=UPI0021598862|nr:hypothetical protein [Paenibacillus radicibacter]MCR8641227.1 hypothetical protein [Paenibacillus radicibacter]